MPASTAATTSSRKALAIAIGVGRVDPKHYFGWEGIDSTCENDARRMAAFAESKGFRLVGPPPGVGTGTDPILSAAATKEVVLGAMDRAIDELEAEDILFVFFSGHGSQYTKRRKPLTSGESFALYDGYLLDAQWKAMLARFKPGVRLLVISESCHSGGFGPPEEVDPLTEYEEMVKAEEKRLGEGTKIKKMKHRAVPLDIAQQVFNDQEKEFETTLLGLSDSEPEAWVLLIAACQANQLSEVGPENGMFTSRLLSILENQDDKFQGDYQQLYRKVRRRFTKPTQSPFYWSLGPGGDKFGHEEAFSI
jgi:hypothetical protein